MVGADTVIITDRYIFVHVPKTGGQSITQALGTKSKVATHTPLRCVEKGNRFAFGFVRNPWARMVSLYRFMCQKPFLRSDNFDQKAVREMGFRRWLMEDQFFMMEDRNPTGEPWAMRTHWRGDGETDLPPMQRRSQLWWLDGCDFIGRTECLAADLTKVLRLINVNPPSLGHINRTTGGDYRHEYDDETRAFVAEHFAPEIERFGYSF